MNRFQVRSIAALLLLSACHSAPVAFDAATEAGASDARADATARFSPLVSATPISAGAAAPEVEAEQVEPEPVEPETVRVVAFRTVTAHYDDERSDSEVLVVDGLPALSADGRYVIAASSGDDFGNGDLIVLHARTGREVIRRAWPQVFDGEEGAAQPIVWDQVRSVRRYLALHAFAPLTPLSAHTEHTGDDDLSQSSTYSGGEIGVDVLTNDELETLVTVRRKGEVLLEQSYLDEEVMAVSVSDDETLLVLQLGFCGCHCASGPVVVPLP